MPPKLKTTIPILLNAAQVAINNTLADAEIQALVAAYGYTPARLSEGQQLYEKARRAVDAQIAAIGAQRAATLEVKAAEKAARGAYQALGMVARAAFSQNKARLAALGLSGRIPRPTASFLAAAYVLFNNALTLSDIQEVLAQYGYDAARLESERAKIVAFDRANQAQEAAKGAAQQATREQEAAMNALNAWVAQYKKIARVALREKKELLEKLGISIRTRRRRTSRAARPGL